MMATARPTDLSGDAVEEITTNSRLLADVFALYVKPRIFTCTSAAGTSRINICCLTSRRSSE